MGTITIRLRILADRSSSSGSQTIVLCRIDPALPAKDVVSSIAKTVLVHHNAAARDSTVKGGDGDLFQAAWDHPTIGGRRFLSDYNVFYRGRALTADAVERAQLNGPSRDSALPFGAICPLDDGEEMLIRPRRRTRSGVGPISVGCTAADNEDNGTREENGSATGALERHTFNDRASSFPDNNLMMFSATSSLQSPRTDFDDRPSLSEATPIGLRRATDASQSAIMGSPPPHIRSELSVGSLVAPRAQRQLQTALRQFLLQCDIATWFAPFAAKAGILSLGELCTHSAESLAAVLDHAAPPADFMDEIRFPKQRSHVGSRVPLYERMEGTPTRTTNTATTASHSSSSLTARGEGHGGGAAVGVDWNFEVTFPLAVYAHRLITRAHWTMKASGLVVDWPKRLRSYVQRVDPERALNADIVESARIRAAMEKQNSSMMPQMEQDALVMEQVWMELREQYEEHIVRVIRDAEERGVKLAPHVHDDGVEQRLFTDVNTSDPFKEACATTLRHTNAKAATAAMASVSTSFLVCCPECKHAFQHTPPSLPWQLEELQRAVSKAELTSIALQKEHAMREESLKDAMRSQSDEVQRLRSELADVRQRAELFSNRADLLEQENTSFRRQLNGQVAPRSSEQPRRMFIASEAASGGGVGVRTPAHGGGHVSGSASFVPLEESLVRSSGDADHQKPALLPPDAAINADERKRIRRVLAQYLQNHNPDGLVMVDTILSAWKHREYELERVLRLPPSRAPKALQELSLRRLIE